MAEISDIFPGHENIKDFSQAAIKSILTCTRAANKLPTDEDYQYYETFKGFRSVVANAQKEVTALMTSLIPGNFIREHFAELDLEEQFDIIKNINSTIFENLENQLDESSGKKKEEHELITVTKSALSINTSWNKMNFSKKMDNAISLLSAKNIQRPQLKFKTKVDNSNSVFMPIIKEKPNSVKPLSILLEKIDDCEEFSHPYEWELERFQPGEDQLKLCTPVSPRPLAETPIVMVETEESLKAMCEDLRNVKEFAVDIEHHSYRSFQGFSCLIQISTREKDYIIDAIALRSELWILNEVLTDPKITKVLHGADMDVLWLQRDFGLYIVNLFDTGQAARVLSFPHLSLVYLLKHYCQITIDKKYQLADWRMRPLPEELLKYAREDTHYLLYVYDCLKNDLLNKGNKNHNLLLSVFQRSKDICLKKYKKVLLTDDSYMEFYRKSKKNFNAQQLYCLKELYEWRDKIARVEDESYAYVLPNHMLLQISEVLPREHQGILACCNPVPPLVRQQLNELNMIISKATLLTVAQIQEKIEVPLPQADDCSVDLNNILQCPHDIHLYEGRTEHELHMSGSRMNVTVSDPASLKMPLKTKPSLPLGSVPEKIERSEETAENVIEEIGKNHKTTYERYLLTKQHYTSQTAETNKEKSPVPAKESEEKSFIEVINPALKAAFATTKKTTKKTRTDPYHYSGNVTPVQTNASPAFSQSTTDRVQSATNSLEVTISPSTSKNISKRTVSITSSNTEIGAESGSGAATKDSVSSPASALETFFSSVETSKKERNEKPRFGSQKKRKSSDQPEESFLPFNYEESDDINQLQSSGPKKQKSSFDPYENKDVSSNRGQGVSKRWRGQKKQKSFAYKTENSSGNSRKCWPKS